MQRDTSLDGGFSSGESWFPLDRDFSWQNVATEREDARSLLNLYRVLLALRRAQPELALGTYRLISVTQDVLIYERAHLGRRLRVALNFGTQSHNVDWRGRILLSTHLDRRSVATNGELSLRGAEGTVLEPESQN